MDSKNCFNFYVVLFIFLIIMSVIFSVSSITMNIYMISKKDTETMPINNIII